MVGTMALVPQIVDAVHVPVIAAGGIADGRGIAAAFALGASGVQMGTAFGLSGSHRLAALPRSTAGCCRRCHRADARLHRPPGPRLCATASSRRWPIPSHWIFRCRRASSAPFGDCRTRRRGRLHAGLGGSGGSAGARTCRPVN